MPSEQGVGFQFFALFWGGRAATVWGGRGWGRLDELDAWRHLSSTITLPLLKWVQLSQAYSIVGHRGETSANGTPHQLKRRPIGSSDALHGHVSFGRAIEYNFGASIVHGGVFRVGERPGRPARLWTWQTLPPVMRCVTQAPWKRSSECRASCWKVIRNHIGPHR